MSSSMTSSSSDELDESLRSAWVLPTEVLMFIFS